VLAYECRLVWLAQQAADAGDTSAESVASTPHALANHQELEHYFAHLERTLVTIGFHNPTTPRQLMARLRRFTLRARPERMELNILRGILTATEQRTRRPEADE
jgi:tRNA/rRNA methyltransferase/tRNA (cytidine32/uridine32-2'-O)-methyltransferase